MNKNSKKTYENNAGTVVSSMAVASITNPDYKSRDEVIAQMNNIIDTYNQYITNLDGFQDLNGGNPNNYIPDAGSITGLGSLVNITISNLLSIALNSKQERVIYCEADTNMIVLAHRLYGLDDNSINDFITTNSIGINEMIQIKKGRKIVWYI